jgi:hypothetical protein
MTLWYFDHRDDSGLEEILCADNDGWKELDNPPNGEGNLTDCEGSVVSIREGDIIIAHGGEHWKKFAEENPRVKIYAITVDGDGMEQPTDAPDNYIVSIRKP